MGLFSVTGRAIEHLGKWRPLQLLISVFALIVGLHKKVTRDGLYLGIVNAHDLVIENVLDYDGLDLGDGHAHGLLLASLSLLSIRLLLGHLSFNKS